MRAQSRDKRSEGKWLLVEVAKKVGGGGVRANTWILTTPPQCAGADQRQVVGLKANGSAWRARESWEGNATKYLHI